MTLSPRIQVALATLFLALLIALSMAPGQSSSNVPATGLQHCGPGFAEPCDPRLLN